MAKLVKTTGEVSDVFPAKGNSFSLEELQLLVGGYIELVPSNDPLFVLCMDEEGKLKDRSPNPVATSMCRQRIWMDDHVVGDVVIGSRKEMGLDDEKTD